MDAASPSYMENKFSSKYPGPLAFTAFQSSFMFFCRCSNRDYATSSQFSLYFNHLHLSAIVSVCSTKKFHWWEVRNILICIHKDGCLKCIERLYWFRTVAIVGSPLDPIAWFTVRKTFLSSTRKLLVVPNLCVIIAT